MTAAEEIAEVFASADSDYVPEPESEGLSYAAAAS
jgi:hypothetical protein